MQLNKSLIVVLISCQFSNILIFAQNFTTTTEKSANFNEDGQDVPILNLTKIKTDKFQLNDLFKLNVEHLKYIKRMSANILNTNESMLNEVTEWDTFEAPYEIRKNYPFYHAGYDEDRRPIWIAEMGRMDIRKITEDNGEMLMMLKRYIEQAGYIILKSIKSQSTPEHPVTDGIVICDMDKMDLIRVAHFPTASFVLDLAKTYQSIIQKHLHLGLIVNTNSIAHTFVNMVRPVYGSIFERIEVHGTNKAKFIPQILKYIPKSQIPSWYGGSKNFRPVKIYG